MSDLVGNPKDGFSRVLAHIVRGHGGLVVECRTCEQEVLGLINLYHQHVVLLSRTL